MSETIKEITNLIQLSDQDFTHIVNHPIDFTTDYADFKTLKIVNDFIITHINTYATEQEYRNLDYLKDLRYLIQDFVNIKSFRQIIEIPKNYLIYSRLLNQNIIALQDNQIPISLRAMLYQIFKQFPAYQDTYEHLISLLLPTSFKTKFTLELDDQNHVVIGSFNMTYDQLNEYIELNRLLKGNLNLTRTSMFNAQFSWLKVGSQAPLSDTEKVINSFTRTINGYDTSFTRLMTNSDSEQLNIDNEYSHFDKNYATPEDIAQIKFDPMGIFNNLIPYAETIKKSQILKNTTTAVDFDWSPKHQAKTQLQMLVERQEIFKRISCIDNLSDSNNSKYPYSLELYHHFSENDDYELYIKRHLLNHPQLILTLPIPHNLLTNLANSVLSNKSFTAPTNESIQINTFNNPYFMGLLNQRTNLVLNITR